ncbi:hypothetical protein TNCV_4707901 [Trichonephila clavipes]|nr:hypothetical protein TNCV_4707901 [Trichonephila clavipes]
MVTHVFLSEDSLLFPDARKTKTKQYTPDSLDDVFTDNLENKLQRLLGVFTGLEMELYASENNVFSAKLQDLEL